MKTTAKLVLEAGEEAALLGISLNKEQPLENMPRVASHLAHATSGSHRKFLRHIVLWWDITAPRKIWTEIDTYKVGTVRNSGSTMHNIHKRPFVEDDFASIDLVLFERLNTLWQRFKDGELDISDIKDNLPEGYMQRSILMMNYEVLRTMRGDRSHHRLPEWPDILEQMLAQVKHPEWVVKG